MKLRPYQIQLADECAKCLATRKICYLNMEVRTGKTLTALSAINYGAYRSVLFVTKKKAIGSIESDYEKLKPCYELQVTNYENLHNISGSFDCIIIDEAHRLGSIGKPGKAYKQLKAMFDANEYCTMILLSGTPTPESYSQLYHQFSLHPSSPFEEGNFYKWAKNYVNVKKRYVAHGNQVNDYSDANREKIMEVLDKYFLRYTQKQAGFTQEITEQVLTVPMKPITYKIVDKLVKDLVFEGKTQTIVADTGVKLQSKVHQLCSGTIKFDDGSHAIIDVTKAEYIRNRFSDKKIAIFYKFIAEREAIESVFDNTTDSPEEFNSSSDCVFVGQVQSAREGVNLSTADALVFYNIDFSALSYWQARDRMSSLTREKDNLVYWVFSEGGIEEKIYKAVMNKKDYTLSHFNRDYDRTADTKQDNKGTGGQGLLFD